MGMEQGEWGKGMEQKNEINEHGKGMGRGEWVRDRTCGNGTWE